MQYLLLEAEVDQYHKVNAYNVVGRYNTLYTVYSAWLEDAGLDDWIVITSELNLLDFWDVQSRVFAEHLRQHIAGENIGELMLDLLKDHEKIDSSGQITQDGRDLLALKFQP